MIVLSEAALADFVAASAAILGVELDDAALAAVREAMRGVLKQASLVLEESQPPGSP